MSKLRPIAIHLPQFHPIPENDNWWGKGFTEWTNVAKARPLFKGHYQPHLPADLGFYDLRLPEARQAQADLARDYGIYGFCYYHYWFTGKRVLARPVEEILKSKEPDFPFMLCWANENWTRRWDGGDKTVLLTQEYSREDDINHIRYLIPYFRDPRYIRVDGKVVFGIYRSSLFPDMQCTINTWREECARVGIELYIFRFETFGEGGKTYIESGFDAGAEFQPVSVTYQNYFKAKTEVEVRTISYRLRYRYYKWLRDYESLRLLKQGLSSRINYNDYVDFVLRGYSYEKDYTCYPCVAPSWDNTARRGIDSVIFMDANPEKFKEWFNFHVRNFVPPSREENFVFVNAWNEWAEGNHLEPCQKWGLSYLEAVRDSLTQW